MLFSPQGGAGRFVTYRRAPPIRNKRRERGRLKNVKINKMHTSELILRLGTARTAKGRRALNFSIIYLRFCFVTAPA